MRVRSLIVGIVAWTLAIGVPALYNVCMAHAAVQDDGHTYAMRDLIKHFNAMPLLMWFYTIAMGIVGLLMVGHGMTRPRLEEELSL